MDDRWTGHPVLNGSKKCMQSIDKHTCSTVATRKTNNDQTMHGVLEQNGNT